MYSICLGEEEAYKERLQASEREKHSYMNLFDELSRVVQTVEMNLVVYRALFNDELHTRKLLDIVATAKEQQRLLATLSGSPQYILSTHMVRALLAELYTELDRLDSALARIAPAPAIAQYPTLLHPRPVNSWLQASGSRPPPVQLSSPPGLTLSRNPIDQQTVNYSEEYGFVGNITEPFLNSKPSVVNITAAQRRRSCSNNFQCRSAAGSLILFLVFLCSAYLYIISNHHGLFQSMDTALEHLRSHCASVPPIAASEFHKRQNDLARILYSFNASAYMAEPGANTLYFGNISSSSWYLSERPLLLIITPTFTSEGDVMANVTILTPTFEASRAKMLSVPFPNVTYVEWAEDEDPYKAAVSAVFNHASDGQKIFLSESSRLFIRDGIQAAAPKATVVSAPPLVRRLRERKSAAEVALLRCANEVTLLAIRAVRDKMYIGISDSTTKMLVINALTSAGLESPSGIVLFGEDAALPHGAGTGRVLQREDLILLDVGGSLHGYVSDVTRTFALAESNISQDHLKIWHHVALAQFTALEVATRGAHAHRVDDVARKVLADVGYGPYFTHRLGHGIGLEGHEAPYLRGGNEYILQTGNTFSDEPGVYITSKVGIRLEDCFVITQNGLAEYLTKGVGGAALSPWHP